jgi:hypothetical protein
VPVPLQGVFDRKSPLPKVEGHASTNVFCTDARPVKD